LLESIENRPGASVGEPGEGGDNWIGDVRAGDPTRFFPELECEEDAEELEEELTKPSLREVGGEEAGEDELRFFDLWGDLGGEATGCC
jgi:hypothetical protein